MNSKVNLVPAVVLGGPPHSGKSVLAYSLSHTLRAQRVPHYVLRAYPDGEGDWANEADRALVRALRVKGVGTPEWTKRIVRDIAARPLPLIVGPGGKPTPWQEAIFPVCTHGILLCPDEASHAEWSNRFDEHGLVLLADFRSALHGQNSLVPGARPLRGTLSGLERGSTASGPAFDELVAWLARLFDYSAAELRALHLAQAPAELTLELESLGRTLDVLDENGQWLPSRLPMVLDYIPRAESLAVFGRGPVWLYAALALWALPRPFYQFDARLGWVQPPRLALGVADNPSPLQSMVSHAPGQVVIQFQLAVPYLDILDAENLAVPAPSAEHGIILSGRLPLWLMTALAFVYADAPWLAVYQPQLHHCAVVIHSNVSDHVPGDCVTFVPPGRA